MSDLATLAIDAHGGLDRWRRLETVSARLVQGGALWKLKGTMALQIAPQLDDAVHRQLYLPDTNVLLTRFLSDSGVAEVSDFMPVEDAGVAHNLVRRAKTVRGLHAPGADQRRLRSGLAALGRRPRRLRITSPPSFRPISRDGRAAPACCNLAVSWWPTGTRL